MTSTFHLLPALFDPPADVFGVVSPGGQPGGLDFHGRRQKEYDRGVGPLGQDLFGSLHVDLEKDIGPVWRARNGRAHEIAEKLGPFEELTPSDRVLECGAIDELIGVPLAFAGSRQAGCPAPAQPEGGVRCDKFGRKRALAGPTGADEHEDQWFSAQSL